MAELRYEVVTDPEQPKSLTRVDLLSGVSPLDKARADAIIDRAEAESEVVSTCSVLPTTRASPARWAWRLRGGGVEVEVVYFGVPPTGTRVAGSGASWKRRRVRRRVPWTVNRIISSLAATPSKRSTSCSKPSTWRTRRYRRGAQGRLVAGGLPRADRRRGQELHHRRRRRAGSSRKLVRRHPHVFADNVADAAEMSANWEMPQGRRRSPNAPASRRWHRQRSRRWATASNCSGAPPRPALTGPTTPRPPRRSAVTSTSFSPRRTAKGAPRSWGTCCSASWGWPGASGSTSGNSAARGQRGAFGHGASGG